MSFSTAERTALLALKGVGPTVLQRLEQMGLDSFVRLRDSDAASILAQGAALTHHPPPAPWTYAPSPYLKNPPKTLGNG